MFNRRQFLRSSLLDGCALAGLHSFRSSSAAAATSITEWAARAPIKLAHREGNMLRQSSPAVYELAARIPGLSGVEVQTNRSNLWDRETVLAYKKEANRWGMRTCSMGGGLPAGESITNPGPAEISLRKTIRSGEILGASVVLVGGFFETCPRMDDESSYGPTVELLKRLGPVAEDAGMTLGLELSLSVADYQKLLGLVAHPAVRAYWDATGTDHMGHPSDGLKGLEVLGSSICQMHLKNGRKLTEETNHQRQRIRRLVCFRDPACQSRGLRRGDKKEYCLRHEVPVVTETRQRDDTSRSNRYAKVNESSLTNL